MDSNGNGPGVRYVHEHPEVLFTLFRGYDNPAIALNCGSMLRDCIRDESLAQCAPTDAADFVAVLGVDACKLAACNSACPFVFALWPLKSPSSTSACCCGPHCLETIL